MRKFTTTLLILPCALLIGACSSNGEPKLTIYNSPQVGCQHLWDEPGYPGHDGKYNPDPETTTN